jgi:hypothetical protein
MSYKKKYTSLNSLLLVKGYKLNGDMFKWTMTQKKLNYLKKIGYKIYSSYKIQ